MSMVPDPLGPLAILTRPRGQSAGLQAALAQHGFESHDWPALSIETRLATDLPDPAGYDLVLFVSGNAVRHFQEQRLRVGLQSWPLQVPIATVGPSSAQACVQAWGPELRIVQPPVQSPSFDSEALWAELQARTLQPRRVLIVRGGAGEQGEGRNWLASRWRDAGAEVVLHSAYLRQPEIWSRDRLQRLEQWRDAGRKVTWLWSSREALEVVATQWGTAALARSWRGGRLVCTHERVAAAAREIVLAAGVIEVKTAANRSQHPDALVIQVCLPHEADIVAAFVL